MRTWSLLGALALLGCSSKVVLHVRGDGAAEGGAPSSGGTSSGSGGTAGTTSASGGRSGAGGAGTNAGGTSSGGTSSGGTAGTGQGAGGGACAAPSGGTGWSFDTGLDGFSAYGTVGTDVTWASSGCPSGGALRLVAQFSGPDQQAAASITVAPMNLNATGSFTAWVRMPYGVPEGVTTVFYKDINSVYASGPTVAMVPGSDWVEISGDLTATDAYVSPGFDMTRVNEIGVQMNTPPSTPATTQSTTVFIDTVVRR